MSGIVFSRVAARASVRPTHSLSTGSGTGLSAPNVGPFGVWLQHVVLVDIMAAQAEVVMRSSAAQAQSLSICSLISPVLLVGIMAAQGELVTKSSAAPDLSCFFGWHHGCSRGISNKVVCCSNAVIVHLLPDLSCFFFGWHHGCSREISNEAVCCSGTINNHCPFAP